MLEDWSWGGSGKFGQTFIRNPSHTCLTPSWGFEASVGFSLHQFFLLGLLVSILSSLAND